ncbi:penicillin-binding protein activator [Litorimonas taeanensis]|nr:penicillin-binding protein activator [Litorimonas taeanensis]
MMKFAPLGHSETVSKKIRFGTSKGKALIAASVLGLMMAACTTTPTGPTYPEGPIVTENPVNIPQIPEETSPEEDGAADEEIVTEEETNLEGPYFNNRKGLTLPHMAGRDIKRLALLLPFSASSDRLREEAESMMKAAELSVFERNEADILLISLDTGGTAQGARSATQAAIKAGADVILGPILADSVTASAREASRTGTPVLAFSTDQTVAGNGAYLLSFPPEAEVERIVDYTMQNGTRRFAYLGPDTAYGRRVRAAYEKAIKARDGEITASETYNGRDISVMQEPAQRLAAFHRDYERRAKTSSVPTPMAFEAIILPEGGTALRSLAPLLPFYDVDPADVQFLGTGLWNNEDTVREPALSGGIFAGADPEAQRHFKDSYDRAYGEDQSRLASLAYDAVAIGAFVADGDPKQRRARLEDPQGFYGVDGAVRFGPDGRPDRGLAVYQIQRGRFTIIEPAPTQIGSGPS